MTAPLLMTGPGGDYVTRFDIKGNNLVKTRTQQSAGHDRDSESAGGAAWGFLTGRRKRKPQNSESSSRRSGDHFERTRPATLPATYAKPAKFALADLHQQLAMLQAIEHWLTSQQDELGQFAAIQTATEADMLKTLAKAGSPVGSATRVANNLPAAESAPAPVRVIRFNSTTMALPTPAPKLTPELTPELTPQPAADFAPEPCHAFSASETEQNNPTSDTTTPTLKQRNVNDDKPQPHPEADENFDINSRHPAIARLFADDERARRSARGLQGNHLRARRSTHQKGVSDQGCEQSTLFGAVA